MSQRQMEVLLVEDNAADQRLVLKALQKSELTKTPHVVSDGVAALSFLRRTDGYNETPRPDVILLDLNLPKKKRV